MHYCCPSASNTLSRLQLYCGENVHELREERKSYASDSNMSHPCSLLLTGNVGSRINFVLQFHLRCLAPVCVAENEYSCDRPVYYMIYSEDTRSGCVVLVTAHRFESHSNSVVVDIFPWSNLSCMKDL